jgi:hypothetical protein
MASLGEILIGKGPEAVIETLPLLTQGQQGGLGTLLEEGQTPGSTNIGNVPEFGGDVNQGLSNLEGVSLQGLEDRANLLASGQAETQTAANNALLDQLTSGPEDFENFFTETIQKPLTKKFKEEIFPSLTASFSKNFFGSGQLDATARQEEDLTEALTREFANLGFQANETNLDRKLKAIGLQAEGAGSPTRELKELLEAGGVETALGERNIERQFEEFVTKLNQRNIQAGQLATAVGIPALENIALVLGGSEGVLGGFLEGAGKGLGEKAGDALLDIFFPDGPDEDDSGTGENGGTTDGTGGAGGGGVGGGEGGGGGDTDDTEPGFSLSDLPIIFEGIFDDIFDDIFPDDDDEVADTGDGTGGRADDDLDDPGGPGNVIDDLGDVVDEEGNDGTEEPPLADVFEPPPVVPGDDVVLTGIDPEEGIEGFDADFVEAGQTGFQVGSGVASVVIAAETLATASAAGAAAGGATAGAGATGALGGISSTGIGAIVAVAAVIGLGIYGMIQGGKARTQRENVYQTTGGLALSDQTKATHNVLGPGHIFRDEASGRVFFVMDYDAASLRQKNATGEYMRERGGGSTMATEINPITGAIIREGAFNDGSGFGFSAPGFYGLREGDTILKIRERVRFSHTPEGQKQALEASLVASAVRTGGEGDSQYTGVDASQLQAVYIPPSGGEGGSSGGYSIQPRPGSALALRIAREKDRSCFIASTLVRMADGTCKPIVDVRIGDSVRGMEGDSRVTGIQIVSLNAAGLEDRSLYTFESQTPDAAGAGWFTIDHPFYAERGWVAINGRHTGAPFFHGHVKEGEVKNVDIHDQLHTEEGLHDVIMIVQMEAPDQRLYELMLEPGSGETAGHRSYYAGQREELMFAVMD